MKGEQNRSTLLEEFAQRKESVAQFAKRHGVSVSSLYRWQSEQPTNGFVQINPEPKQLQGAGSLVLEKGDLRMEFSSLPDVRYLQSMLEYLLQC